MADQQDRLVELLQQLDAPQPRICNLERYATGTQPLAFLSPDSRIALGSGWARLASNLPRLAVTSLAERLRITGFEGADVWTDWLRQDMDQLSYVAHAEALTYGASYVTVWGSSGKPQVSIESAKQVAVIRDPGSREILRAVKRWRNNIGGMAETWAVAYYPDHIERWHANQAAATAGFNLVEELDNPLGVVPVVQLRNGTNRILDDFGCSEIDDLVPLVDGLNALLHGMLVAAEFVARPRRTATGIDMTEVPILDDNGNPTGDVETVSPFSDESYRFLHAEPADAKFGQLPAADLAAYENAVNVLLGQIMAVSALPAHYVGIMHDNPASADAIRSAEASLTARAEARAKVFGRAWENVARLMVAVRDGTNVDDIPARVQWCDPSTRSESQIADSVTKLVSTGILSRVGALRRLGYSQDEIERELKDQQLDTVARQDPKLNQYLSERMDLHPGINSRPDLGPEFDHLL